MGKNLKKSLKIFLFFAFVVFALLSWTIFIKEKPSVKLPQKPAPTFVYLSAGPRIESFTNSSLKTNKPKKIKNQINQQIVPKKEVLARAPAPIDHTTSSSMMAEGKSSLLNPKQQNENYNSKQISIQGLMWTMQSSEQRANKSAAPMTSGVGIQGTIWMGNHGFEGRVKSGLANLNSSADQNTQVKNIEGRYYIRHMLKNLPFGVRETQLAFFTGAEIYRNSGTSFSNEYDLLKLGSSFEFPLFERWSGGGDIALSLGPDQSSKQEVFGNVRYHYTTDWSMSLGYRMHLFSAGSKKASPTSVLPFREGYTEGYSSLNYHF